MENLTFTAGQAALWLGWAGALLVFGTLYGFGIRWLILHRPDEVLWSLLVTSILGVGFPVVWATPWIGWEAILVVMASLSISAVPVVLIVLAALVAARNPNTVRFGKRP